MKKKALWIPVRVWRALIAKAKAEGVSVRTVVYRALERELTEK